MTKETLDKAIALGFTTQEELKIFEFGYLNGCKDTLDEAISDVKKSVGDELDFLTDPEWNPTSVTMHTNKDK